MGRGKREGGGGRGHFMGELEFYCELGSEAYGVRGGRGGLGGGLEHGNLGKARKGK